MAAGAERGAALPAEPPPLSAEEVARRLASTRRELGNRRKILLRNLPAESSSQEIHDLFKDYEIKYCYVDRNKRTAFVTLLNGEQAQSAIRRFHQHCLRGKEISVQLQPTDALLCITNLPLSLSIEEFEELVRAYGNVERCFLVYSELTGHSKGYGFVEYMKKDSAAKARLELLGKQLEESTLFAQWMDVNQLTTNLIHSKCLCVDKLQKDCADSKELLQAFSLKYKPVFCQFAQDEEGGSGDFAVVEYESAEQAERVRGAMDGVTIHGRRLQVSFCAPGAPGRSTLAALIAAQRMMRNNRKGLLPEPNPVQIMKSFNNPAMLQMLLQPQLRGHAVKPAVLGASAGLPHLINSAVGPPFLQLNKVHQSSVLGSTSSLLLQSPAHLPLAQQQLLKMENMQANKTRFAGRASNNAPADSAGHRGDASSELRPGSTRRSSQVSSSSSRDGHAAILPESAHCWTSSSRAHRRRGQGRGGAGSAALPPGRARPGRRGPAGCSLQSGRPAQGLRPQPADSLEKTDFSAWGAPKRNSAEHQPLLEFGKCFAWYLSASSNCQQSLQSSTAEQPCKQCRGCCCVSGNCTTTCNGKLFQLFPAAWGVPTGGPEAQLLVPRGVPRARPRRVPGSPLRVLAEEEARVLMQDGAAGIPLDLSLP